MEFIALQGLNPISDEDKTGLNLFSRGSGGKITNLFGDRVNLPSRLLFDFADSFGPSVQPGAKCQQTVAAFAAPTDGIPNFQMISARTLEDAPLISGPQPIRFDSHPDFGRRYALRAGDETAVRAFFNLPFLDRLTASDPEAAWSVEKAGRWLLVYRHNQLFAPDAIPESWQRSQALANLFLDSH
ncbi:MAG: hypothetical protein WAU58_03555 [Terriglobales bacterium]